MKRATQRDVALLAGVSRATVYYVLNGRASDQAPISDATRDRVLKAVTKLNYEPDHRAQALRTGETKRIGLLIPDNANPHYWQRVIGIEQAARKQGYDILLSTSSLSEEQEAYSLKALSSRRVDGVVVTLAFIEQSENSLGQIAERRLPIVLLQRTERDVDTVDVDYGDGMKQVMSHLIALGHERIGLIFGLGTQSRSFGGRRLEMYREGLSEAGFSIDERLIKWCGATVEEGHLAALHLMGLHPPPTALVALNDLLALGAMRATHSMGLRIPEDVSIVGFDDIPLAQHFIPSLTTVHSDADEIGRAAVQLLLERLQEPSRPAQKLTAPAQLVVRESTGAVLA